MKLLTTLLLSLSLTSPAWAVKEADLPKDKHTKLGLYLSPTEAYQMIQAKPGEVVFIDVRTPAEMAFVGMPTVADANIPYMIIPDFLIWDDKNSTLKLELNPDFEPAVRRLLERKGMDKNATVIVMCRSGGRSAAATNLLAEAGYTRVHSIYEGFEGDTAKEGPQKGQRVVNGWKQAGLPWSYKLDKQKIYGVQ